jgi:hypothetical protein
LDGFGHSEGEVSSVEYRGSRPSYGGEVGLLGRMSKSADLTAGLGLVGGFIQIAIAIGIQIVFPASPMMV